MRSESETVAQELGEDLQDNVFTALRVLGRGFVETNDLEIDPDDEASLDELKEQSLVLLYRLMFVLYAESRGLIHPESEDAIDEYEDNFSLDELRLEIHDEIGEVDDGFEEAYSEHSTTMWSRLEDLFRLVDEGEESLGIPPYNGGLFNRENHEFLTDHEVSNRYLAEVIYRISTTENDEGRYVLADYADLDTRHLGSVYEGLLEHQFRIAPEQYAAVAEDGGQVWQPGTEVSVADAVETVDEGGLYVVNDEGERKATGAYYTPDYVVTYIVEETVDPLIEEIREDLQDQGFEPGTHEYLGAFYRRVLDLKVLDPAMGSGHFLTRATEYLAQQVMEEVREIEEATTFDEQRVRRDVAKECIYGVDLNGMAVELAKLSMWLETLSADQPLAFLDHHLKAGNSLVGSDVTEVLSSDAEENGGQLTLEQALARVRQDTLEHVMERMQELLEIDNETLEDVKSMEEIYDEVRSDPFYQRLFELTNVHTAERFDLDVPEGAYERMAQAIEDEDEWLEVREEDWFQTAQEMAGGEAFFHWELEYPEVFFNEDGEKREDAGFDAVIGNPPYVSIENLDDTIVDYLRNSYTATEYGRIDIYLAFIEQSNKLCMNGRYNSMIVPDKWLVSDYGESLRSNIIQNTILQEIWDLRNVDVFPDASNSPIVYRIKKDQTEATEVEFKFGKFRDRSKVCPQSVFEKTYENKIIIGLDEKRSQVIEKVSENSERVGDFAYVSFGAQPGSLSKFVFDNKDDAEAGIANLENDPEIKPFIRGRNIERFLIDYDGEYLLYSPDELHRPAFPELFENNKIVISEISSTIKAAYDQEQFYGNEKVVFAVRGSDLESVSDEIKSQRPIPEASDISAFGKNIDLQFLTSLLNSTLLEFYFQNVISDGLNVYPDDIRYLPITRTNDQETLANKCEEIIGLKKSLCQLNTSVIDHFGSYSDGRNLSDIGLTQPPEGAADSILTNTAEDRENLRVGTCEIERESPTSLEIRLTARYKPESEDEYETDQWGYTETEPLPALRISDLTETEADLIEAFVPVAVDEAGGFANFRENATKTNSLVDRLRKLTLPAVDDVRDGLESYRETKARAEDLEEKIEKTDELIDEIVYELYGLTDEEIEIVEEAVTE
uniref:Eco57I restriction-modification methylase domain-containing protein n=1 Tax=Halobiforma nitratireducens TaxID=130048 RepID=UPI001EF9E248|nr:TaqI-like C-terminal specificity domain-containing protein [Halobiforma nitratireducens]